MDKTTLIQRAAQIKNETTKGANTADRVGSLFEDMLEFFTPPDDPTVEYTVMFSVGDSIGPIEGATVSTGGTSAQTDSNGTATFALVDGSYSYTVTKTGYDTKSGTFTVQGDSVNISVVLSAETTPVAGKLDVRTYDWTEWFTQAIYDQYDATINNETNYTNKIYIDPSFTGTSDGTIGAPYKHLLDTPKQADTAYLFKRGTAITLSDHYYFGTGATNIMVGAYGTGVLPAISGKGLIFETDNPVIRDISVPYIQLGTISNAANNATVFNKRGGSMWSWSSGLTLIGSEITNTSRNGLFQQLISDNGSLNNHGHIDIGYCWIHKVNQNWTPTTGQYDADGDAIQITTYRGTYHIHNNILDRHDTGNKQLVLITAYENGGYMCTGTIEGNFMIGPMSQPDGTSILMLGNVVGTNLPSPTAHHWSIVRNNIMVGSDYNGDKWTGAPIYGGDGALMYIYGNMMLDCYYGGFIGSYNGESAIYNNTLIRLKNTDQIFNGVVHHMHNNIFGHANNITATTSSGNNISIGTTTEADLFEDPATDDFRLKALSPAIDAGTWQTYMDAEYTHDLLDNVVPQTAGIDVGSLQYVP